MRFFCAQEGENQLNKFCLWQLPIAFPVKLTLMLMYRRSETFTLSLLLHLTLHLKGLYLLPLKANEAGTKPNLIETQQHGLGRPQNWEQLTPHIIIGSPTTVDQVDPHSYNSSTHKFGPMPFKTSGSRSFYNYYFRIKTY